MEVGKINKLKVSKKSEYGYFLKGEEDEKEILIPYGNIVNKDIVDINSEIEVFIYRDSKGRMIATQKTPKAVAGEVKILKVADNTDIGSFIDIGLERDILVPFREKKYLILEDEKYPFYIYVDKSGRLAATTDVDIHMSTDSDLKIGDTCNGYVYGFQTNKTALVCIEPNIAGIILRDEYYKTLKEGDYLKKLRVIKIYEDGKLGLSTRGERKEEMYYLENRILSYMEGNDGFMRFNDKSDPEELRIVFNTSKKNFKRTLGNMMKNKKIEQDEDGTWLVR